MTRSAPATLFHRLDRVNQLDAGLGVGCAEPAARHAALVVAADSGKRTFQRLGVGIHQSHRNPGIGEAGSDASAHGAGADDGGALDRPGGRVLADTRHLAHCPLGEERVAERRRFRRWHAFLEDLPLLADPLVEGERQRHFDALQARNRCPLAARPPFKALTRGREDIRVLQHGLPLAGERMRRPGGDPFRREGERAYEQVAIDHPIKDSLLGCLWGRDTCAVDDHRERRFHTREPGQALGPAGAGREAEQHLRLADLGIPARHPVVA